VTKRREWQRGRKGKPFELFVPPTRNNDQCDSILACEFAFQFISMSNFFQCCIHESRILEVVLLFLYSDESGILKKDSKRRIRNLKLESELKGGKINI